MKVITGTCKICGVHFPIAESAHPIFREYCAAHHMQMIEEHDLSMEVIE